MLKDREPTEQPESLEADVTDLAPGQRIPNSTDSSGLKVDDPARGEKIKEQLKRGAQEIRPMD